MLYYSKKLLLKNSMYEKTLVKISSEELIMEYIQGSLGYLIIQMFG